MHEVNEVHQNWRITDCKKVAGPLNLNIKHLHGCINGSGCYY